MTPSRRSTRHSETSRDDAAARITAYVYGNLLILAALFTLTPDKASEWHGVLVIFATGFTTFLAHIFADALGERVRHDAHPSWSSLKHELRNATPIVTSASIPAVLLLLSVIGVVDGSVALIAAEVVVLGRIAFLGTMMNHVRREKASLRSVLSGVGLAVAFGLISLVKAVLTH